MRAAEVNVLTYAPEADMAARTQRRWMADVTTDSTHPPERLFTKKRFDHRKSARIEEGLSQRTCVRYEDADLLY